jgi:hypothetical protein
MCLATAALFMAATPAFAQNAAHGQQLYGAICRACHGFPPAGGPEFTANNPGLIITALTIIAQMKPFASQISASDAADISAYIASLQDGTGGGMTGSGSGNNTPPQPEFDYTDLWFDATESGWGMNIVQHASGNVFAVIYTYDTPNRPMWFVMPGGSWTSSNVFTGSLYRVTGSPAASPFKAGGVVQAGTATLTFSGASTGSISYTANGTQVTKSIEKQPF